MSEPIQVPWVDTRTWVDADLPRRVQGGHRACVSDGVAASVQSVPFLSCSASALSLVSFIMPPAGSTHLQAVPIWGWAITSSTALLQCYCKPRWAVPKLLCGNISPCWSDSRGRRSGGRPWYPVLQSTLPRHAGGCLLVLLLAQGAGENASADCIFAVFLYKPTCTSKAAGTGQAWSSWECSIWWFRWSLERWRETICGF